MDINQFTDEPVLNTNTRTVSGIIPMKLHDTFSINAAKIVSNAGSAAFEESCRRRRVITSISQNVVLLFQMHLVFRCSDRAKTKRRYAVA